MSGISCHVLDTALGRPASGLEVWLERWVAAEGVPGRWLLVGQTETDADGRAAGLEPRSGRELGAHRLSFETEAYFQRVGHPLFFPRVQVQFLIGSRTEKYHIPLLLSPFGYSTYRGS